LAKTILMSSYPEFVIFVIVFEKFKVNQDSLMESDFDKHIRELLENPKTKNKL